MEEIQSKFKRHINIASYFCLLMLVSCKPSFQPIEYGKDACANCKMTIVDTRFAAELVTGKGRSYKFDDILCMKQYLNRQNEPDHNAQLYVADYTNNEETMIDAKKAVYVVADHFRSPMNGNCAAFATLTDAKPYSDSMGTKIKDWNAVIQ